MSQTQTLDLSIKVKLAFLKFAEDRGRIVVQREEFLDYLEQLGFTDEEISEVDKNLHKFLYIIHSDEYSEFDMFTILLDENAKIVAKTLVLAYYEGDIDSIENISNILLDYYKEQYTECLTGGTKLGLYIQKVLEKLKVEPIRKEGDEQCYKAPYTCTYTKIYPMGIKVTVNIDYCNHCLNDDNGNFIQKCTYYKLPNEIEEDN